MATITGKWRWNDTIEGTEDIQDLHINIRFDSIGERFHGIRVDKGVDGVYRLRYLPYEGSAPIVFQSTWNPMDSTMQLSLEEYRIIDFRRDVLSIDQDAYEFIVANAEPFYDIADKLRRVYNNVDTVYYSGKSAGREEGKSQGYTVGYTVGYDDGKRDGKTEGRAEGKAEGLKEGYNNGYQDGLVSSEAYEKGKQAEYDAFWDSYQQNGNRKDYQYGAFGGLGWDDVTYKPKYPITATHVYSMYTGCRMTRITNVDFSNAPVFTNVFQVAQSLLYIDNIELPKASGMLSAFNGCIRLQTIGRLFVNENMTYTSTFANCSALENITFDGVIGNDINFQRSTKLTRASIENIINHLSDNGSGKTLTLSEAAVDKAFETEDLFGSETDEWATLYSSKPNWQITLV